MDLGLGLYSSLRKYHPTAELYVLALSHEAAAFLEEKALPGLHVVRVQDLLRAEPKLEAALSDRTPAERAFTLTPFVVMETLKHCQAGGMVVYLDADMLFFGSVTSLLDENQSADVVLSRHNFSKHMESQQRFGLYNTGFTGFRKTIGGERCAKWWAEQCLEWCGDRLENGRFADQKYIEQFGTIATNTMVIESPGLNCAPWNASGRRFSANRGKVLVDGRPLILFHFAKVKRVRPWCIATGLKRQGVVGAKGINRHVYRPYAKALGAVTRQYSIPTAWILGGTSKRQGAKQRQLEKDDHPGILRLMAGTLTGKYVVSV